MCGYSFDNLKNIKREQLGEWVPMELYRAIRLIGMYEGLPMKGKGTTFTVGKKIGEKFPINTVEEALALFEDMKIGVPTLLSKSDETMRIQVDDCFCKGVESKQKEKVCDLEGAILAGAMEKVLDKKVHAKETKCHVSGDVHCEYEVTFMDK
ncbi:V4R domain-containing protein [Aquibacillus sediminis]|uniref:V4R domain-containing protein n=1 Tax=Aquibacillus sediminis TaxID=2574734 RepID=UPI001108EC21|nr:V4R domain-containing protein [Aquibacillus sediminis]